MDIQSPPPFLAIIMATNRPEYVRGFLENLRDTAGDPSSFEVLIRVDEGDEATHNAIRLQQELCSFRVHMLVESNADRPFLHNIVHSYNRLTFEHASASVYFFWNLTDEIRLRTKGWDHILKSYIKLYEDDIFRIELSKNNLRNYYTLAECVHSPDNYPVTTRRWLSLVGGWGDCWGTDSWQQCIDWYLGQCRIAEAPRGMFRSVPVFSITMDGQEDGQVQSEGQDMSYRYRLQQGIIRIFDTVIAKENFNRLALRLNAHAVAKKNKLDHYILQEDYPIKHIRLLAPDHTVLGVWSWGPRHIPLYRRIISLLIRYSGRWGRKTADTIKSLARHSLKGAETQGPLKAPAAPIPGYHFHEEEITLFPSGNDAVAKLIDAL